MCTPATDNGEYYGNSNDAVIEQRFTEALTKMLIASIEKTIPVPVAYLKRQHDAI